MLYYVGLSLIMYFHCMCTCTQCTCIHVQCTCSTCTCMFYMYMYVWVVHSPYLVQDWVISVAHSRDCSRIQQEVVTKTTGLDTLDETALSG